MGKNLSNGLDSSWGYMDAYFSSHILFVLDYSFNRNKENLFQRCFLVAYP